MSLLPSKCLLPFLYTSFPPSLSPHLCGFCWFGELDQLPKTVDKLRSGTREKVQAQLSLGEGSGSTPLGSSKLLCQLVNLIKAHCKLILAIH